MALRKHSDNGGMLARLTPERLSAVFATEPAIIAAWLFGSTARGQANPFSDVDFAVLLQPDSPQGLDRFVLLDRLARALADILKLSEDDVDVSALNEQGLVFQHEVLRSGLLLYEADRKARTLFTWRVMCRYLDFRPTLEIFDRARRRQIRRASAPVKEISGTPANETASWNERLSR